MHLRHLFLGLALAAGGGATVASAMHARNLVLSVPLGDPEMQAASRRARAELASFYERLESPAPDEGEFMVAYDIIPGDEEELVWAEDLVRTPTSLTGVLRTQPQRAEASAFDPVTIAEPQIVDWIYRKGAVMRGGYTYRVLISRMPSDESAMLREHLGW